MWLVIGRCLHEEALHVQGGAGEDHEPAVVGLADGAVVSEEDGGCGRPRVLHVLVEAPADRGLAPQLPRLAPPPHRAREHELADVLAPVHHGVPRPHRGPRLHGLVMEEGHHVVGELEGAGLRGPGGPGHIQHRPAARLLSAFHN